MITTAHVGQIVRQSASDGVSPGGGIPGQDHCSRRDQERSSGIAGGDPLDAFLISRGWSIPIALLAIAWGEKLPDFVANGDVSDAEIADVAVGEARPILVGIGDDLEDDRELGVTDRFDERGEGDPARFSIGVGGVRSLGWTGERLEGGERRLPVHRSTSPADVFDAGDVGRVGRDGGMVWAVSVSLGVERSIAARLEREDREILLDVPGMPPDVTELVAVGKAGPEDSCYVLREVGDACADQVPNLRVGAAIGDEEPLGDRDDGRPAEFVPKSRSGRIAKEPVDQRHRAGDRERIDRCLCRTNLDVGARFDRVGWGEGSRVVDGNEVGREAVEQTIEAAVVGRRAIRRRRPVRCHNAAVYWADGG